MKDGRQVGAVARRDGDRLHAKAGVALQYNLGRKCGRAFQRDSPSTLWYHGTSDMMSPLQRMTVCVHVRAV